MAPKAFGEVLDTKKFTNGADSAMVKTKYTQTFDEVMSASIRLDFSALNWGPEDFKALAGALAACSVLQELAFNNNAPGREGIEALAAALPLCGSLQRLQIAECGLGDDEAVCIIDSYKRCPKFGAFIFDGNYAISPEGIVKMATMFPQMVSLQRISLCDASVGEKGSAALVKIILECPALRSLKLTGCNMPEECKDQLQAAWTAAGKTPTFIHF